MRTVAGLISIALAASPLAAQEDVQVTATEVAPGVHMLVGQGGNIGVSSGPDGVFLIDDQYAPLTEKILAAVRTFSDGPIRFVVNTHWHGDHVGGNENFGGMGALIVAHDNVRARMRTEQFQEIFDRTVPASSAAALPVVTFSEATTFFLNGDEIHVFHVPHAHTDGDALVYFRNANVVHMGDTYFNGLYPYIEIASGGSIQGIITAADAALAMGNEFTAIIPGHGPLATKDDLRSYRTMLETARDRVASAMAAGHTLEEIQNAGLTQEWDEAWGGTFITPDQFVMFIYRSLEHRPN